LLDLGNKNQITRLYAAIDASRNARRPFNQNRIKMLREFVGSFYNSQGAPNEVLVNLLNMTADAYTIGLAARNPRVRVVTDYRDLWPFAYRYQKNLNDYIEEIHFSQTLQQIVLDAFFTQGIAKVFQAEWQSIQLEDDVWADPGRPYVGRISPDYFGMDMSVNDVRRCKFMWDEYRVSWDSVKNDPDFDKSVVARMSPNSKWERTDDQANQISAGSLVDDDELEPMVDLMDVWLPDLRAVGVFSRHVEAGPLKLVDEGPEGGPFQLLSFADVPDNLIPTSPAHNLMGLHLLYNGLLRKQARQAKRQKVNPTYRPSAADDADRMRKVSDGDWVKVSDPAGISVVSQGGVDQTNVAFSIAVLDLFDRQAGNLKAMAGLGQQAATLGQEELIYSAASRKEAKMQYRVHDFTSRVMQAIGNLMWNDSTMERQKQVELGSSSGIFTDISWTPDKREGDFWQYNFEIEPYSMNYEPPEAKAQKMQQIMQQIQNLYPILQASGGNVDVQELIRHYADTMQMPELANVITFSNPPTVERSEPTGSRARMPQQTSRTYVRKNIATGGTAEARSSTLQQALLQGGQANQQQMATLTR